jgi:hypothetical protein
VHGCTNDMACNFNYRAQVEDGTCEYATCYGCMSPKACNYDSGATHPSSCNFVMPLEIVEEFATAQDAIYSYPMTAGSDYVWSVEGGVVMSGNGTSEVRVVWSKGEGIIAVKEINSDGCEGVEVISPIVRSTELGEDLLSLSIFPNPANDIVSVKVSTEFATIRIIDVMGRVILETVVNAGVSTIDISDVAHGTYRVMASSASSTVIQTLVIGK